MSQSKLKRFFAAAMLALIGFSADAQMPNYNVHQKGTITAGNAAIWAAPNTIQDGGAPGSNPNVSNATGTLAVANGGTGANQGQAAVDNFSTSTANLLPNTRACLAKVARSFGAGYGCNSLFIGDSTFKGIGANNSGSGDQTPRSLPTDVAVALNGAGIAAHWNAWMGDGSNVTDISNTDARVVVGSSWTQSGDYTSLGGQPFKATTNTNAISFTPVGPSAIADKYVVYYIRDTANGSLSCNIDGGTATVQSATGALSLQSLTLTATARGKHTLNCSWSSGGPVYIQGENAYDSTLAWVHVINAGWIGSTSTNWNDSSTAVSPLNAISAIAPANCVINLGINDVVLSTGTTTYTNNIQGIITACKAAGADVILMSPNPMTEGTYSHALQVSYFGVLPGLATSNSTAFVNEFARELAWGIPSAGSMNTLGLVFDGLHPNGPGYVDMAKPITEAFIILAPNNGYMLPIYGTGLTIDGGFSLNPNHAGNDINITAQSAATGFSFNGGAINFTSGAAAGSGTTSGPINFTGANVANGTAGIINFTGGSVSVSGVGGGLNFTGGNGTTTGGPIVIQGGNSGAGGGTVSIAAGTSNNSGVAPAVTITGGASTFQAGGALNLNGGQGGFGAFTGGAVVINPGAGGGGGGFAGNIQLVSKLSSTAATPHFLITGIADTALTASTESSMVYYNLAQVRQHATGALTLQREMRIDAPTYSFVGASTLTDAATVGISGAPVCGTNATCTNSSGIIIPTSALTNTTNGYGINVTAPSGATNNYAAKLSGKSQIDGVISGGTKFTTSGCSVSATTGGATAGTYTSGTTGSCAVVITMNGATGMTAPTGWSCFASDRTTQADLINQTASTATTATMSGTTVTGDIISFACMGY